MHKFHWTIPNLPSLPGGIVFVTTKKYCKQFISYGIIHKSFELRGKREESEYHLEGKP